MRYAKVLCYLTIAVLSVVVIVMAATAATLFRAEGQRAMAQRAWSEARSALLDVRKASGSNDRVYNLQLADASDAFRAQLGASMPAHRTLVVTRLKFDSGEVLDGIEPNDILLDLGGQPITNPAELQSRIEAANGQLLAITLLRRGEKVTVQTKPSPRQDSSVAQAERDRLWLGVTLGNVDPALAAQLGLTNGQNSGVLVSSVNDGGPASKAGVKTHDILLTFGGEKLTDPARLTDLVQAKKAQPVMVEIIRAGKKLTLKVVPERREAAQGVGQLTPTHETKSETLAYSVVQPGIVTSGWDPSQFAVTKQGDQFYVGVPPQAPDPAVAKRLDAMDAELKRLRMAIEAIGKLLEPSRAVPEAKK